MAEKLTWPPAPDDLRILHMGISMAITIYDAVEAENGVPKDAPLYGKRDRLVELARRIDHEANCAPLQQGEES